MNITIKDIKFVRERERLERIRKMRSGNLEPIKKWLKEPKIRKP